MVIQYCGGRPLGASLHLSVKCGLSRSLKSLLRVRFTLGDVCGKWGTWIEGVLTMACAECFLMCQAMPVLGSVLRRLVHWNWVATRHAHCVFSSIAWPGYVDD